MMKRRTFFKLPALLSIFGVGSLSTKNASALSADSLGLPQGIDWALYVEGMREIRVYDIRFDDMTFRWDTFINGRQYTVFADSPPLTDMFAQLKEGEKPTKENLGRQVRRKAIRIFADIASKPTPYRAYAA